MQRRKWTVFRRFGEIPKSTSTEGKYLYVDVFTYITLIIRASQVKDKQVGIQAKYQWLLPLLVRNQIINALSFASPKKRKEKGDLCQAAVQLSAAEPGELSERERRTENTWVWSSEAGQNHFHLSRQQWRERESCLHSLHTLSNSYYRLSAALTHSHSDAGWLYIGEKMPPLPGK